METRKLWRCKGLIPRLVAGYVLIPFVSPFLLLFGMLPYNRLAFRDWIGIVLLYAAFGFAALLVLGTPLLVCYFRFGWTGFLPFMAAGGGCAYITSYAVLRGERNLPLVGFLTMAGILSGLLFRIILFGFRRNMARQ